MIVRVNRIDDAFLEIDAIFVQVAGSESEIGDLRLAHLVGVGLHINVERRQFLLLEIRRAEWLLELCLFERSLKRLGATRRYQVPWRSRRGQGILIIRATCRDIGKMKKPLFLSKQRLSHLVANQGLEPRTCGL
ncbi:hypothetical protein BC2230_50119 [Burkholderia cepacia]